MLEHHQGEQITFEINEEDGLTTEQIAYIVREAVNGSGKLCTFVHTLDDGQVVLGCSSTFTSDNTQVEPAAEGTTFRPGESYRQLVFVTPKDPKWHAATIDTDCPQAAITGGLRLFRDHVRDAYERAKAEGFPSLDEIEV